LAVDKVTAVEIMLSFLAHPVQISCVQA